MVWPKEVCLGWHESVENKSEDTHYSEEAAQSVCMRLILEGFGCNRQIFPIDARVEVDGVVVWDWKERIERKPKPIENWNVPTFTSDDPMTFKIESHEHDWTKIRYDNNGKFNPGTNNSMKNVSPNRVAKRRAKQKFAKKSRR